MNQTFELLKLIIFGNAYYFLGQSNFIIFILISLIIKISKHVNIELNPNNIDPFLLLFNIIFLFTKIIMLQLDVYVYTIDSTYLGNKILKGYNIIENLYCNFKSYFLNLTKSKLSKIIFGNNINMTIKKQVQSNKLNSIKDINNFLDNLEE
jgi:hypothetical protein